METFKLMRAADADHAIRSARDTNNASTVRPGAPMRFLAGGTTLLDLMKLDVEQPSQVIDINRIGLDRIETTAQGGVRLGALVRNSDLARDPYIEEHYAVLSQALLSGASAQLRNMATTGGNLLQRTRCVYFRDVASACNKRQPGSGCSAMEGMNRNLAILGTSDHCIATNPSDMNVALTALEATIHIQGTSGERAVAIDDFFLLPGTTPQHETVVQPGDLITYVSLPPPMRGRRSVYLKLRDRASYEFALASAAVSVSLVAGQIEFARIAMGGIGTRPWRMREAEAALQGRAADRGTFRAAAEVALAGARPQSENGFKIELAKRCLTHALSLATQSA